MELKFLENHPSKPSEKLMELESGMFSPTICNIGNIHIEGVCSFLENPLFYFKVFRFKENLEDKSLEELWLPHNNRMCRISMVEPKYLGYEHEDLILTKEEVKDMIEYFKSPLSTTIEEYKAWTNWTRLIHLINYGRVVSDLDMIDYNLPMPDYSLLPIMG